MFATPTVYTQRAQFIDLSDVEFFQECLNVAKDRFNESAYENLDSDHVKRNTPVVYVSTLSKIDKESESLVERKTLNSDRGRRKFLMIDADFNPGEEEQSAALRESIIKLADEHNTYALIYPTVSYPEKPRFRAVMFVKRAMTRETYHQAMLWWFDQLSDAPTDESDFRMSANRNVPVFTSQEQIDGVFSNLDDESRELLDNKVWSSYPKPKKRKRVDVEEVELSSLMSELGMSFDQSKLVKITREETAPSPVGKSYHSSWRFIDAVARSVVLGEVEQDVAVSMMEALATRGETPDEQNAWRRGNIKSLERSIEAMSKDMAALKDARELISYKEFISALKG